MFKNSFDEETNKVEENFYSYLCEALKASGKVYCYYQGYLIELYSVLFNGEHKSISYRIFKNGVIVPFGAGTFTDSIKLTWMLACDFINRELKINTDELYSSDFIHDKARNALLDL